MSTAEQELRAARSQMTFRALNNRIKDLGETSGSSGVLDFSCECADETCVEKIRLSAPEFRAIAQRANQFIVLRGHELPEVEDTIAQFDGFGGLDRVLIVSKRGAGAEFVKEHS